MKPTQPSALKRLFTLPVLGIVSLMLFSLAMTEQKKKSVWREKTASLISFLERLAARDPAEIFAAGKKEAAKLKNGLKNESVATLAKTAFVVFSKFYTWRNVIRSAFYVPRLFFSGESAVAVALGLVRRNFVLVALFGALLYVEVFRTPTLQKRVALLSGILVAYLFTNNA